MRFWGITWGDVTRWRPEPLADLVGVLNNRYNQLLGCADGLRATAMPEGWSGPAADAAAARANQLANAAEELAAEGATLRRAAGDVSDAITGVLHGVKEVESMAAAHEFRIGEDGSITSHAPPPVCTEADPDGSQATRDRQRIAVELQDRIQEVLSSAEDVDSDFCAVLDRILSNQVIDSGNGRTDLAAAGNSGAALGALSIPAPPPPGATPAANAAWWATLSQNQKQVLMRDHPELVGNRDGVEAWARNQANLAMVPKLRAQLQQQYDALVAQCRDTGPNLPAILALKDIRHKLDSLNAVDKIMRLPTGEVDPNKQLLTLDVSGRAARAAIANGNVDTAQHVAVFTPGMNSAVNENMAGYVHDMKNVRDDAQNLLLRYGDGSSVATVTWLGYEPPAVPVGGKIFEAGKSITDLVGGDAAVGGANKLAQFDQGINASRTNEPHMTALGHSYGSLTTGIALQQNTGVDDTVFFGSPGITGKPALGPIPVSGNPLHDLQVPTGHAYDLAADGDPIAHDVPLIGRFGPAPQTLDGMNRLSTDAAVTPDGQQLTASHGHSEYTKVDTSGTQRVQTTSEYNLSAIVAGMPQYAIAGRRE
ncbi:alpha/beta hydrolase [Amycolatopsis rhizosphaerae]|uniref:Alpha/beta hydrolase n=1 Tax=Amycolatopsis rhizosphaerae TaxID=2053003 RepID=A0A558C170_9PSEU|nr:alpha/beta hydrolase [Amycolatopsis rhizosphaerae]TVT42519.1 alpha/beta hydrolase [Amycolatopsis rhizosphaerae]